MPTRFQKSLQQQFARSHQWAERVLPWNKKHAPSHSNRVASHLRSYDSEKFRCRDQQADARVSTRRDRWKNHKKSQSAHCKPRLALQRQIKLCLFLHHAWELPELIVLLRACRMHAWPVLGSLSVVYHHTPGDSCHDLRHGRNLLHVVRFGWAGQSKWIRCDNFCDLWISDALALVLVLHQRNHEIQWNWQKVGLLKQYMELDKHNRSLICVSDLSDSNGYSFEYLRGYIYTWPVFQLCSRHDRCWES